MFGIKHKCKVTLVATHEIRFESENPVIDMKVRAKDGSRIDIDRRDPHLICLRDSISLNRDELELLLPVLERFLETGSIEEKEKCSK